MNTSSPFVPKSVGRALFLLGIAVSLAGIVAYVVIIMATHVLHTPWYAPGLATLGAILILAALWSRPTVTRGILLFVFTGLAVVQWWFIGSYSHLPRYAGPVTAGKPFPEFAAEFADGKTFTRADLASDKETVLVFFRGRW